MHLEPPYICIRVTLELMGRVRPRMVSCSGNRTDVIRELDMPCPGFEPTPPMPRLVHGCLSYLRNFARAVQDAFPASDRSVPKFTT